MRCPKCKNEVNDGVKYCNDCGYAFGVNKLRDNQMSNLASQKALRVLGWIFVPFVMVFVSWKSLRNVGRFYGVIWAVLSVLYVIGNLNTAPSDKQLRSPVSAMEQKTPAISDVEVKAQKEAEYKAKKDEDSKAKEEADAKSKTASLEKAPHIGEATEVGKLNVAVWKGALTAPSVGDGILKYDAKGMYWLIRVGVSNKDKESRTIDSNMFKLVGPDGTTYDPDTTAGRYANDKTHFFLEKINPGIDIEGFVVFDMPASLGIEKTDQFILRVDSGIGFKGGSHVDFVLKKR
ncbi:hypothetical protein GCM10008018_69740 [Paenibacillus marchantiophytorum]|uniref:DUF4352 domain-containing protein n=1 Tax=Paenibacillus marchantiophytorum TaxID=1619310 RepID=A0ABQ1FI80_9BACL|nr:DUF4352 domain-containing protein [Paenibacillus marchantiophytorum]GGA14913.1 hypothetical protein GCM10008018_69740 [Paenibacillus marchantiophytorum]